MADTMILVSYDVPNKQINMMSIPRDTAVNVSWSTKKLNSVYNAKESSGGGLEGLKKNITQLQDFFRHRLKEIPLGVHPANIVKKLNSVYNAKESSGGGLEGLKKHVAYLTGVMPDFHVIIEWKAVGEIVDARAGCFC